MALLNLDKIVLHRTVIGVACPECVGVLNAVPKASGWLQKIIRKKEKKVIRYRCQDCKKLYEMAEVV